MDSSGMAMCEVDPAVTGLCEVGPAVTGPCEVDPAVTGLCEVGPAETGLARSASCRSEGGLVWFTAVNQVVNAIFHLGAPQNATSCIEGSQL